MKLKSLVMAIAVLPGVASADTYDMTGKTPIPIYSDATGYGYEVAPDVVKGQTSPYYFSVKVPDGNYRVTVELGDKKIPGSTTLRAENRRLMAENIETAKGESKTVSFIVNKRSPQIDDNNRVALKPREMGVRNWDDRLTIEVTGQAPQVKSISVEPAPDDVTTVYLCGNSTVVDQENEPWASWGQMIPRWFDDKIAIANHAYSGLATSSFIGQKRLDKIMSTIKPGDWVIVEFGHNDQKERSAGSGAYYNFAHNLKIFIDRVRGAKANIVFVTPTQRRAWEDDNATIKETHGDYPAAMVEVARREGVPVIDLHQMTREFFQALGYEDSKRALVHYPANTFTNQPKELADNTHFNPYGAYEVAKMVVTGMKGLGAEMDAVTRHLRHDFTGYDPNYPDSWNEFYWPLSQDFDTTKPYGN